MAYGLNRAEVIGRLGDDVTINQLSGGGRVANLSIATDESYMDKQSGEWISKAEWHKAVTYQDGLITMLEKHAKKGRLVFVSGTLRSRKWRKEGEDSDRTATEIFLVPSSRVQFLDKIDDRPAESGEGTETAGETTGEASAEAEAPAAA